MGATVGGTALKYNLFWVTQFQKKGIGVAKRGLDGSIAVSTLVNPSSSIPQLHKFKFTWITRAQLVAIETLYRSGNLFTIVTSTGGNTITNCIPLPFEEDGLTYEPIMGASPDCYDYDSVASTQIDLFNSEIRVYATV